MINTAQEFSGSQLNYSHLKPQAQDFLKKHFSNSDQNKKISDYLKSHDDRAGISFDFKTKQYALFYAVANFNSDRSSFAENIIAITLDQGLEFLNAKINFDSEQLTPLALAVKLRNVKAINFLLTLGADCQDKSVITQLKKHLTTSQALLDEQVDEVKKIAKFFIESGVDLAFEGNEVVNSKFTEEHQKLKKLADLNKKLNSKQLTFNENKDQQFIKKIVELLSDLLSDNRNFGKITNPQQNTLSIALVHGVEEDYSVNANFLKKIILQAYIVKSPQVGCCGLFNRTAKLPLKVFLENHQDQEIASVVKGFFKMMDDQKTSQIIASSSRQSSLEVRKSGSGHPKNDFAVDKPENFRGIELESDDLPKAPADPRESPNTRLGGRNAPIGAIRADARFREISPS